MADLKSDLRLTYVGQGDATIKVPESVVEAEYTARSEGAIDIPDQTTSETVFEVSLGSIDSLKAIYVRNNTAQDLGIRLQEADADEFSLAPGGYILIANPVETGTPIDTFSVVTTVLQEGPGTVDFLAFGD